MKKKNKMKTLFPLDDFIEYGSIKLRAPLHFDWFAPYNKSYGVRGLHRQRTENMNRGRDEMLKDFNSKRYFRICQHFSFFYTISFEIRMLIIVYNVGMSNGGTRLVIRGVNSNLLKYTQTKNLVYKKRCVIQYELDLIEQL